MKENIDSQTVDGFGQQWSRFDQTPLDEKELFEQFERYFAVFPWADLPQSPVGMDVGCGSGRWAKLVAARVGRLHCIDASAEALNVARQNLANNQTVEFHRSSLTEIPIDDDSMDFGYSLGVLHHVPDTQAGIIACVRKLKAGAPFLVYLYYSFDNRPAWFRLAWRLSDVFRRGIAALPFGLKWIITDLIAISVYMPLATISRNVEALGGRVDVIPLSNYRHSSFYTMRTDALDRFGTRLEHRFTRDQIARMMCEAGLDRIEFSNEAPYWCAVGFKKSE